MNDPLKDPFVEPPSPERLLSLRREDWDFSLVLEEEYDACLRYELAREIRNYVSYYGLDQNAVSDREGRIQDHPDEIFVEEAHLYIGLLFPRDFHVPLDQIPAHYPFVSWQEIPSLVRKEICFVTGIKTNGVQSFEFGPLHTAADVEFQRRQNKGIHRIRIDWTQSDASLLGDFRQWLEENRPADIPVTVHRGRQSLRDDLNALSAMRLRHHYRANEASDITSDAFGHSLYNGTFAWDRAAERGVHLFKSLFPKAGRPRSATSKSNLRGRPLRRPLGYHLERAKKAAAENKAFLEKYKVPDAKKVA